MDYVKLGKQLRRARHMRDLTQEELAERAGISTSFVGHIERGTRVPSLETVWRMCRAMNISIDYLMDGMNDMTLIP